MANTVGSPWTMMVHFKLALSTSWTMRCSSRFECFHAFSAFINVLIYWVFIEITIRSVCSGDLIVFVFDSDCLNVADLW